MTTDITPAPSSLARPEPAPSPGAASAPPTGRRRTSVRPLVLRLHFYAGILVAPLLVVACVTGLLYTTMPQVEGIVHRKELHVDRPAGAQPIALIDQVRAARAAHPEGTISSVRPSPRPDRTTRVVLDAPGTKEGYQRTVFVDPYTGRVQGELETFGEWLPVRAWFDDLHRNLHLGETGRLYSETAASWLWVVVLGGVWLLVGRRRAERRRATTRGDAPAGGSTTPAGRWSRAARAERRAARPASGRLRTMRRHRIVGGVAAVGLLALSATGLTWSKYTGEHVSDVRERLSWQTPSVDAGAPAGGEHAHHGGATPAPGAPGGDHELQRVSAIDDAVRVANGAGLVAPLAVTPPAADGGRWQVQEARRSWPVRQDAVAVNPTGTQVTDVSRFDDWPIGAKLTTWGISLHMGLLFGIANQLVLAGLAIALLVLIVLGYRMWWQRRPKQGPRLRAGKPMPRGAWRHLPWPALVPVVLVTAAVGWFVPLLGITLVAFLVLDVAIGLLRRLRTPSPAR